MAYFSYRAANRRSLARALLIASIVSGATISSVAQARDDILISLDPSNTLVAMELDDHGADLRLVGGSVSLATDDPYCVATPTHPCRYTVNLIRLNLGTFFVFTEHGKYTVADPHAVVQGPIEVVDDGVGLVIPVGELSQGGGTCSGPHIDTGYRTSTQGLPVPLVMILDVNRQMFQLHGDFVIEFEGHNGIAGVAASGGSPFTNLPPIANAGGDLSFVCPQTVTLDASGTTDPNDSIAMFTWSVNGATIGSIPGDMGSSVSVPFGEGSFDVLLEAFDTFGGRGTDRVTVTVTDPVPEFSFVPADLVTTSCGALNIGQAQAADPCGHGAATITNDAPASFPVGVTLVTWTATSSSGKKTTAVQRVQVDLGDDPACCPANYNVIVGTSNNDTLVGTAGNDCILGRGAQDTIEGADGDDLISGGDGDDIINAGSGNDRVYAGNGQDRITGGDGDDLLSAGDGDDLVYAGNGDDTLFGGQGQDTLHGEAANDRLFGGDGEDTLYGGDGNDHLAGNGLHDTCTGGLGANTFTTCEIRPDAPGAVDSCSNGSLDGAESGVDCGSLECLPCAQGLSCTSGADCGSNVCTLGVCAARDASAAGSPIHATISINPDWTGGYCGVLNVKNPTPTAYGTWSVVVDTKLATIYSSWNGTLSSTSGNVGITPVSWNASLSPYETDSSIGFCLNRNLPGDGTLPVVLSTCAF